MRYDRDAATQGPEVVADLGAIHVGQGHEVDRSVLSHRFEDPKGGDPTPAVRGKGKVRGNEERWATQRACRIDRSEGLLV